MGDEFSKETQRLLAACETAEREARRVAALSEEDEHRLQAWMRKNAVPESLHELLASVWGYGKQVSGDEDYSNESRMEAQKFRLTNACGEFYLGLHSQG